MSIAKNMSSPSVAPDLDWSQVSETVRMLNLSVAQISMAMQEGEDSVGSLTTSFTNMVSTVDAIAQTAHAIEGDVDASVEILGQCSRIQSGIQQSIIAFQFYDRLSQRLEHVKQALEQLGLLVADSTRLYNPQEWRLLQEAIRSRYSMQEEQDMFDALLNGATVDEALETVRSRLYEGDIDDIELF